MDLHIAFEIHDQWPKIDRSITQAFKDKNIDEVTTLTFKSYILTEFLNRDKKTTPPIDGKKKKSITVYKYSKDGNGPLYESAIVSSIQSLYIMTARSLKLFLQLKNRIEYLYHLASGNILTSHMSL